MGFSPIQLLLEINGDASKAEAAVEQFGDKITTFLGEKLGVSKEAMDKYGQAAIDVGKGLAAVGGVAAGIGGTLFAAAEHAAHFAEEVGHVAEKSGATAEQVSTLNFAADRMGVSSEAVGTALRFLARNLGEIAEGQGKNTARALADLGINARDAGGQVRSVSSILPEVIERMGRMEAGSRRTADAIALFGKGGAEVIPMLGQFRGGFKAVEDAARAAGMVIGDNDVRAAQEFLIEQRRLNAQLSAFALVIGREVMPAIIQLFVKLENFPLLLERIGLQLASLASYLAGPVGMLLRWILIDRELKKVTGEMDQAITDELVKLDALTRASFAAAAATGQDAAATEGDAKAHHHEAAAIKEHADASAAQVKGTASHIPTVMQDLSRQLIEPLQQLDLTQSKVSQDLLKQLTPSIQTFGDTAKRTFADLRITFQEFKNQATDTFSTVGDATIHAGIAAAIYGQNVDKALAQAAKSTMARLAEQAASQALYAAAQGLWFLAQSIFFGDPQAAAAAAVDFEAVAEWGAIAGVTGGAAAAIRTGSSSAAGSGSSSYRSGYGSSYGAGGGGPQTGAYGLAPGAAGARNPPSGNLTVMVVGEAQAGNWLCNTLNNAVQRGNTLNATTVQKSPFAGG